MTEARKKKEGTEAKMKDINGALRVEKAERAEEMNREFCAAVKC